MLENLALTSLGSLIAPAKPFLKSLSTFLEWSGAVIAVLELIFGPHRVKKALNRLWRYVRRLGEGVIPPVAKLIKQRTFISAAGTERERPSPWWEDGPVHGSFLWLVWGPPHLYSSIRQLYAIAVTAPGVRVSSVQYVVVIPVLLASVASGLQILSWIPNALESIGVLISGLWRSSGIGYWAWCEPKMAKIREKTEAAFYNRPLSETQTFIRPKIYQYLLAYFTLLVFFRLIWPGIAMLLLIGGCLILIGQLLEKATVGTESVTSSDQPRPPLRTLIKPQWGDILLASFALPAFFGLIWPGIAYLLLLGGCLWLLAVLLQFASAVLGLSARLGRWPKAGPAIIVLGFLLKLLIG